MNHHEQTTQQDRDTAARTAILADFRATFTSDAGRNVLALLRQSAGVGTPSFLPPPGGGPFDPFAAAFRDGRKSILDQIKHYLDEPEDGGTDSGPHAVT